MIVESATGIEVAGEAGDVEEAIAAVHRPQPDVVLIDVRMPAMDGLEATRRILASNATGPRIIMLNTFDVDE
jgi:DNA-binding NarL/FixJ family response regulator